MANDKPDNPDKPVIDLDADEHNANWLRILAQRRQQQPQQPQQDQPQQDQPPSSDQKVP